jgi:hypothetical protein
MKILLALPNCGHVEHEVIQTIIHASKDPIQLSSRSSSMLPDNFNVLWCQMMNGDFTHFAMIHSDVTAEPLWIDKLLAIMEEKKSDVFSVVMPIKDETGDTSTAFKQDDGLVKRLSLKQVRELPETFDEKDVGKLLKTTGTLLVNTGLWIAKRGDWCKKFTGFRMLTDIFFSEETKKWQVRRISEDWEFSMWAKEQGLKVHATRKIQATHIGRNGWRNYLETHGNPS